MTIPISVEVWMPLKAYRVTVKHRILSELGELSKFVLNAMNSYALSIEDVEQVTGLQSHQLHPIIERLQGLRLLSHKYELTESGQTLAYILRNIHDKSLQLAIDQHYNEHLDYILLLPVDSPRLQNLPTNAIKTPRPKRLRTNSTEDEYLQSQRIQRKLPELLPKLIPEFENIIPNLGKRWGIEWDIQIERDIEHSGKGLCLNVELKSHQEKSLSENNNKQDILRLFTPLLVLETIFLIPNGLDFENNAPAAKVSIYSESDDCIYHDHSIVSTYAEEDMTYNNDSDLQEYAIPLMNDTVSRLTDDHQCYSRTYEFSKKWQHHEYNYRDIIKFLDEIDFIKG
ncbi:hypothetical protein [Vibrio parahaemolyticus]|uniref:hypothetical protein n=1 Tax=Vibrio parahaemolyticus TaxID=670 RepID=UPI00111FDE90|nr:hypothetical protein [Vibrio parahaemolyticus]TOP31332.1 hypothetical protein CGH19_10605 [Vibrio parahaemolyticus]